MRLESGCASKPILPGVVIDLTGADESLVKMTFKVVRWIKKTRDDTIGKHGDLICHRKHNVDNIGVCENLALN